MYVIQFDKSNQQEVMAVKKRTKLNNTLRILREIWLARSISRVDIARRLKLNKSTVTHHHSEDTVQGFMKNGVFFLEVLDWLINLDMTYLCWLSFAHLLEIKLNALSMETKLAKEVAQFDFLFFTIQQTEPNRFR